MENVKESVETSTMRAPRDVIHKINVLAAMDGKSIVDFNDTDLREWVDSRYAARMAAENRRES